MVAYKSLATFTEQQFYEQWHTNIYARYRIGL